MRNILLLMNDFISYLQSHKICQVCAMSHNNREKYIYVYLHTHLLYVCLCVNKSIFQKFYSVPQDRNFCYNSICTFLKILLVFQITHLNYGRNQDRGKHKNIQFLTRALSKIIEILIKIPAEFNHISICSLHHSQ